MRSLLLGLLGCVHPGPTTPSPTVHRAWAGTAEIEGHFATPGERRPFSLAVRYDDDGAARRLVLRSWDDDPEQASVETLWLVGDRGLREVGGEVEALDPVWTRSVRTLMDGMLASTTRSWTHPTFGDVEDSVLHDPSGHLSIAHPEVDHRWWARLDPAEAEPDPLAPPPGPPLPPPPGPPRLDAIADGVWALLAPASDTISLVVELGDGLFVVDAGLQVATGEAMVDLLRERFPDQPVRHVSVSHHHPHYTGGLRAYLAEGATLHAPAGQAAFARQIAARRFSDPPDRLAARQLPVDIEPFAGRATVAGSRRRVELIDIGAGSRHTDEYVLVWVPDAKLLFQGDIGWFVDQEGDLRASRRAVGLSEAIETWDLDPQRLLQGWPLEGSAGVLDRSQWDAIRP